MDDVPDIALKGGFIPPCTGQGAAQEVLHVFKLCRWALNMVKHGRVKGKVHSSGSSSISDGRLLRHGQQRYIWVIR